MAKTGYYPGSFDPITFGHLDIILRASRLVDRLVIGVGAHHGKKGLFEPKQRIALIEAELAGQKPAVSCTISFETFDGLVVDAAKDAGADMLIRGLRNNADFEYERQMAVMNQTMAPDIETIYLTASPATAFIASSLVKQIARMGGDISKFVPTRVAEAIARAVSGL